MLNTSWRKAVKSANKQAACHPEPIRCAQGKLRERSGSRGTQILPLRFAQGFGSCAQHDSQGTGQVRSRGSLISKYLHP
jgi:hypothetical protein